MKLKKKKIFLIPTILFAIFILALGPMAVANRTIGFGCPTAQNWAMVSIISLILALVSLVIILGTQSIKSNS